MAAGLNRRGGGILGRVELEAGFPRLDAVAAVVAAVGSGLVAEMSDPSMAQPPVAGSRAATRAHARFCSRCFRIALQFTELTPFTPGRDDLGWSHLRGEEEILA